MSQKKSLCLRCTHLIAEPPYDALSCALGKNVRTLSDPPLCREYIPAQRRKVNAEEVEDPDQLALFEPSVS